MFRIKKLYPKKWNAKKIVLYVKTRGQESELPVDCKLDIYDLNDIPNGGYAEKMLIDFGGKVQYTYDLEGHFHNRNPMTLNHRDAIVSAMTSEKLNSKANIADELALRDEYIEKLERMLFHSKNLAKFYADADYSSTMESRKHIVNDRGQLAKNYLGIVESLEQYDPHHLGIFCSENKEGSLQ